MKERAGEVPMQETANGVPQWKCAVLRMRPTDVPSCVGNTSNVDGSWHRLVRRAQKRWLRENPW